MRRRIPAALAVVVALSVVLSGCASWFRAPETSGTSTPTHEQVAANLESFYDQVLVWTGCGKGMQCATATAPLDWSNPQSASISLALVRHPATGDRLGSLLVNPGGPGGSGYDLVHDSVDYAVSKRLQASYDVVGFDPRGVGRSTAVRCTDNDKQLDAYNYDIVPGTPGSPAWLAAVEAENAAFGKGCLAHTGPLLGHVDTESAARDLDLLRAILGDAKLNYLGYSYGTYLGATYAQLYPDKTGRLVFDGALDPATSSFDVTKTQAVGFENAFRAYLKDCLGRKGCPFSGTVDDAIARTRALLDQLQADPIPAADGRMLGATTMWVAIILPLYNKKNWPYLDTLFSDAFAGGTKTAFLLADSYNDRNPDGTYSTNTTEAFMAVNCLDYASDDSVATMRTEAAELTKIAPVFGPQMGYGGTSCATWPFTSTRQRGPIAAAGSGPILVVGTTNDPATPYVWAQNMAAELQNGHLVTYHGEGHTAYNKSNSCVDDAVDDFFVSGTVPKKDPDC